MTQWLQNRIKNVLSEREKKLKLFTEPYQAENSKYIDFPLLFLHTYYYDIPYTVVIHKYIIVFNGPALTIIM